jgi:redox-sensitive bicupin YhaK (pirin superfamily)
MASLTSAPSAGSRGVARVLRGLSTSDGAGVKLTRVIGTERLDALDPFLMLDEFGSDDPQAYVAGFPDHPHRGFETITYMLAGRMRHRDNRGNEGLLGPGDAQWMTAARGIVHSEMPEQQNGLLRGFQFWLNLPAAEKMLPARYQDIVAERIPKVTREGLCVAVVAGEFEGAAGPVAPVATAPVILDLVFSAEGDCTVPLPLGHAAFAYVYDGAATIAGTPVSRGELAVLGDGAQVNFSASGGTRILCAAARPLNEPVARYGPFVMNTRAEIQQAFSDYHAGRF